MAIKRNATGEALFILWDKTQEKLIKRDIAESARQLTGLEPHLEYYAMEEALLPRNAGVVQIDYDIYSLSKTEGLDTLPSPPVYRQVEAAVKRPLPEILSRLDGVEIEKNGEHLDVHKTVTALSNVVSALAGLARKQNGQAIDPDDLNEIDKVVATHSKLKENKDRKAQLVTQLTAGQTPNIREGWAAKP